MLFNSFQYIFFLCAVVLFNSLLAHRYRWFLLLAASYYFYMCWKPGYIILIIISTLVDYTAAICIAQSAVKWKKRAFLLCSLGANLGLLFWFKYYNFFSSQVNSLLGLSGTGYELPLMDIILPVGISFYTFQTLSYTIEVYRGTQQPVRHIGKFALYVSFFPQLVAGPIERPGNLLPQIFRERKFDNKQSIGGIQLILWGLFKKVVVADRLAILVDKVYGTPENYSGMSLVIATLFFAYQIYCDFSGYTDIAIGSARLLGFKLMQNFKTPYYSKSIPEFWRRWHISLSTWFKDYVYIPLGGNRRGVRRWVANIIIVFVVSGLWHGASWTFVIWGALHGFYYLAHSSTRKIRRKLYDLVGMRNGSYLKDLICVATTFILTCAAWVFFRASSVTDATYIISHSFYNWNLSQLLNLESYAVSLGYGTGSDLLIAVCVILFLETVQILHGKLPWLQGFWASHEWFRWLLGYSLVFIMILLGKFDGAPFIYFQF